MINFLLEDYPYLGYLLYPILIMIYSPIFKNYIEHLPIEIIKCHYVEILINHYNSLKLKILSLK
jgi:hypothetical protein